jgi:hypothetical protein
LSSINTNLPLHFIHFFFFLQEGNSDRAFAIGERIVATHKSKSAATRFSTYCAMTKLAELLWPLAIEAGKRELAKTLAQVLLSSFPLSFPVIPLPIPSPILALLVLIFLKATFDEAPSWKNLELLQKSYTEQEWPARKEQLLSMIRTGQAPYVAIPSVRYVDFSFLFTFILILFLCYFIIIF